MAYTINRRLAELIDSNGQLVSGKIANGYITTAHYSSNSITDTKLHTSFSLPASALTAIDTDDVSEGSTNIYFTNARADARIAAATTDDLTEGSNLYYTDARVGTYISGNRSYGNITTTGYIAGPATFTIDPAAVGDNTGTVVIAGNLQVDGTTTTINSTTMTVDDLNLTLASGAANAAAANGAGITVDGASATITYDGTNDEWDFNKHIRGQSFSVGAGPTSELLFLSGAGHNGHGTTNTRSVASFNITGQSAGLWFGARNDETTGIIGTRTATGNLAFETYNSGWGERMRITYDGNVGIGTGATVNRALEIAGNNNGGAKANYIRITDTDTSATLDNQQGGIEFYTNDNTPGIAASIEVLYAGSGGGGEFTFNTAAHSSAGVVEAMRIDASGNVGIGTASPTMPLSVQAASNAYAISMHGRSDGYSELYGASNDGSTKYSFLQSHSAQTKLYTLVNTPLLFGTNSTERMRINSSGNVVINKDGFSSLPTGSKLNIFGDGITLRLDGSSNTTKSILFRQTGVANPGEVYADGSLRFRTEDASTRITFHTNSTGSNNERMRIDSSGNVGIGTDSPDAPLAIHNSDLTTTAFDGTGGIRVHRPNAFGQYGWFEYGYNSDTTFIGSKYSGGTAASYGQIWFAQDSNGGSRQYPLVINGSGNVGIGTTSFNSGARLEVNDLGSVGKILLTRSGSPRAEFSTNANEGELSLYRSNNAKQVYFSSYYDSYITGGNLGIGNTDPNVPLTVTSNSGANAIAIRARSAGDYGFLQFYNNAGTTIRGQVYSHSTGNAVGISTGNSVSNGIKIDGDGLHFQKTDGQKISAKESIVMEVDTDNNTASRVFQVTHGNGKTLLNLHDDYRTEVGTLQYSSTRSAGAGATGSFSSSAGDWVDVATVPYGRNVATIKFFWDGLSAPGSAHHGLMEFDIASHYGTSYYYGWDSSINLKNSTAHNSFYISEARIITPNGSGATGYFQVKFAVAVSTGTFRSYVTARDEQCSIDPVNPVVNNSRSGTTIASLKMGTDRGLTNNRLSLATSRDMHIGGGLTILNQHSFNAYSPAVTSTNNTVIFGNARHNVGGRYSTSTGRFTAGTSGKYLFTFDVLMDSSNNANYGRVLFRVNNVGGTMEQYGDSLTYQATGQSYFGLGLTCIISLNVGDYVEVYNAGQWATYGTAYGVFCGHLLG